MKLTDFNPRHIRTENIEQVDKELPFERSLVKVPGIGVVHIDALKKNITEKINDLARKMNMGDPESIQEVHQMMNGAAFNAMFDALNDAYKDLKRVKVKK